jgi:hypothetical protein
MVPQLPLTGRSYPLDSAQMAGVMDPLASTPDRWAVHRSLPSEKIYSGICCSSGTRAVGFNWEEDNDHR